MTLSSFDIAHNTILFQRDILTRRVSLRNNAFDLISPKQKFVRNFGEVAKMYTIYGYIS